MLMRAKYKTCKKCNQLLPTLEFPYMPRMKDGFGPWCRDCHAAHARKWSRENRARANANKAAYMAAHPEAREWRATYGNAYRDKNRKVAAAATRQWTRANPERVRMQAHVKRARKQAASAVPFTEQQLRERLRYFGNKCWMCGAPGEHLDHVKPLSKGGPHMLANLRPACGDCNNRKSAKWPFPMTRTAYVNSPHFVAPLGAAS